MSRLRQTVERIHQQLRLRGDIEASQLRELHEADILNSLEQTVDTLLERWRVAWGDLEKKNWEISEDSSRLILHMS